MDCSWPTAEAVLGSYRDSTARAVAAFEIRFLTQAMEQAKGRITTAAHMVGTDRRHLGRLLKKHSLHTQTAH